MAPEDLSEDKTIGDQRPETPDKPAKPSLTPRAEAGKAEREERVAAEMKKNLLKRKQQQRTKQVV